MRVIFLDIDGVLNDNYRSEPFILPQCAKAFNRIVGETGAKGIIASSCQLIGVTPADGKVQGRGRQITAWLADSAPVVSYVVLDDDEYDIREHGHPLVRTDARTGLSEQDADLAIELLTADDPPSVRVSGCH